MRYLFVGMLLAGLSSMPAFAEGSISEDGVFERLCEDSGYAAGSDELDRCVRNFRKDESAQKDGNASAVPDENTPQPSAARSEGANGNNGADNGDELNGLPASGAGSNRKTTGEDFCENYDFVKGSAEYEDCLATAAENGYAGDETKHQEAGRTTGKRKKRRL